MYCRKEVIFDKKNNISIPICLDDMCVVRKTCICFGFRKFNTIINKSDEDNLPTSCKSFPNCTYFSPTYYCKLTD